MASQAFWTWVNAQGLTPNTDPAYYYSGDAAKEAGAYENAIKVAIENVKKKPLAVQQEFFARLKAEGGMSADSVSNYYTTIPFGSGDMNSLITAAGKTFQQQYQPGAEGSTSQAIPRNAKLVKIGNAYRVVWNLGDGLGHAWYSIGDFATLKNIFGEVAVPHYTFSNVGQFEARFGNQYWGDIREVDMKAETPWEDLDSRIESQFGFVPGFQNNEIRRLMRQAFFEKWTPDQFQVQYRSTNYYKTTTDQQRQWVGLSQAEKNIRISDTRTRMAQRYRELFGTDIPTGSFAGVAEKIAAGTMSFDTWAYQQGQAAGRQSGTPEFARRFAQQQAANEPQNQIENMTKFAADQYQIWVGPGALPANFANTWGRGLATGTRSEADLETYLKGLSKSRWAYKPPDVTWEDWAAPFKAEISDTLELGSLNDGDPLLGQILRTDLTGVDLQSMIRSDKRFLSTAKMYEGLSSAVSDVGRRFGFIT